MGCESKRDGDNPTGAIDAAHGLLSHPWVLSAVSRDGGAAWSYLDG
jgi:hypothetical protein